MSDDRIQPESRIEQVRELMFGPQLRECSSRIQQLESLLSQSRDETHKRLAEVRDFVAQELSAATAVSEKKTKASDLKAGEELADVRTRIEELEERFNARLKSFEDALRASVEGIEKRLQALGQELQNQSTDLRRQDKRTEEKLENRVQFLNDEIESSSTRLRSELAQANRGMQESLHGVETQLSTELRRYFNDVRYSKVSKDEISDILVEFGMRLKGMDASSTARLVSLDAPSGNDPHRD